jgi:hypothetical protein
MANATIRSTIIYDYAKNKRVAKFIREFPASFPAVFQRRLENEVATPLLEQLQTEPQPAVLPFGFETEKSRRWYFANKVPKGKKGGRYIRTHAFVKGWKATITINDNAVALTIRNPYKATKFITGDRQVRGHRITGWQKHAIIYGKALKPAKKAAIAAVKDILATRAKN